MKRSSSITGPVLIAVVVLCVAGVQASAQSSSVSGVVRDSHGTPQIGAIVELLRPDLSVVRHVYTNERGHYIIPSIVPGTYEVEASGAFFLPTMRENLSLLAGSRQVVNLTLDTLYEAFRWLPAQPRQADEPKDDWTWTLRLSANRPLLRLLQNGPLVVVTDSAGSEPTLKARVTVWGGDAGFGNGGIHNEFEMERAPDDTRAMILRADLTQSEAPALNAVLGYEQRLALGRSFRTISAIEDRPDIAGGPHSQGLQAGEMRSGETMNFGFLQAQAGDSAELVHLNRVLLANHPFAEISMHHGETLIAYRVSTAPGIQTVDDLDRQATVEPTLAERNGAPELEEGLRQEIDVERSRGNLRMRLSAWRERVDHPVVTGGGTISRTDWNSGDLLYDGSSGLLRAAGQNLSGDGMMGEVSQQMTGSMWISFDAGVGEALDMSDAAPESQTVAQALDAMRSAEVPMVRGAVHGKLAHAGTEWRASYRWQNARTVTPVDAFSDASHDPYLSLFLRQPIRLGRLPNGVEALVDVRNLLAEGYRPFLSRDGSTLYFAQAARCVEGGLSFSF
ncbi:MAG: carboxypeptidase-like regulatory domain-containing protein [Acidobacteriaceae bacterium]